MLTPTRLHRAAQSLTGTSHKNQVNQRSGRLQVSWHDSVTQIDSNLFDRCFPEPLEGRWWYESLEQSGLETQFTFAYAVITSDNAPVAIAPTFIMNVPMELVAPDPLVAALKLIGKIVHGAEYQRTLFVGSPCTDEGTIGLAPGVCLSEILPILTGALETRARIAKASVIAFKDFPAKDESSLDKLIESLNFFKMPSYPGTIVDLPKGGFDEYLASLKGSRRHNIRKKLKRSQQTIAINVSVVQNPEPAVLKEIFGLFWQTYTRGKTKFERLNPEFFHLIGSAPCSYFILLRQSQTEDLVAFMLCFKLGDRVINKFIGFDYTQTKECYLYFRLWEAAVTWASSIHAIELQSGQTGYRAKIEVGHRLTSLTNYCRHRNPLFNWIYGKVAQSVSWSTLDKDLETFLKAHPAE